MNYEELGYMGRYARAYRPRVTMHGIVNNIFADAPTLFIPPSAIVVQQKKIPDVSFYQGEINYDLMRQKTDALIIRAGQNEWVDSQFKNNWRKAKQYDIKRGSYWFYDDRKSPGMQAVLWASLLRDDYPEMEIWCDWENSYGGEFRGLPNVVAFMQAVERLLPGVKVGMYTGYWWFREHSSAVMHAGQYSYLSHRPLFEAWFSANSANVLIPNPWTSIFLWQFGTPAEGRAYGVHSEEIDMSFINMTETDFQIRYGGATPPPTGETMSQWYRVNTNRLNIRDAAGAHPTDTSATDIGDLLLNDRIEAEGAPVNGWLHIVRVLRAGNAVPVLLDGWCSAQYCVVTSPPVVEPPTTPPAEVKPVELVVTLSDGSKWRATGFQKVV